MAETYETAMMVSQADEILLLREDGVSDDGPFTQTPIEQVEAFAAEGYVMTVAYLVDPEEKVSASYFSREVYVEE